MGTPRHREVRPAVQGPCGGAARAWSGRLQTHARGQVSLLVLFLSVVGTKRGPFGHRLSLLTVQAEGP